MTALKFISMLVVDMFAVYGVLRFLSWAETINPVLGNIISFIVVLMLGYHYYCDINSFEE